MAPSIQPSVQQLAHIQNILVIPVEAPPLQIIPDPIEERLPVYRHEQNMTISVPMHEAIYKNPGNVLIAGHVSEDDIVVELDEQAHASTRLEPRAALGDQWMPTSILAEAMVSELRALNINARLSQHYFRLPVPGYGHDAYLFHWHTAVSDWYAQDSSQLDYRQVANDSGIDAVLEIGLGTYRIFEGQVSLQVLVRLIDPHDNRLLARTQKADFRVAGSAQALLENDSHKFKQVINVIGNRLIRQVLSRIGFSSKLKSAGESSHSTFVLHSAKRSS
ncbi:hypothetical protein GO003_022915 [Methylicorpusculum oleiharenae]|uniref:hypothetical protein n=1 Tax=Methylicorpusculum oleiharenae TaxID=1338687 RepID=UPI0013589BF4|nr:hypothetical protein [Methylicorpusculum oleiharenae]MCD2453237.1 hypothetical protein [Methylicorpusculum oleiharenae]